MFAVHRWPVLAVTTLVALCQPEWVRADDPPLAEALDVKVKQIEFLAADTARITLTGTFPTDHASARVPLSLTAASLRELKKTRVISVFEGDSPIPVPATVRVPASPNVTGVRQIIVAAVNGGQQTDRRFELSFITSAVAIVLNYVAEFREFSNVLHITPHLLITNTTGLDWDDGTVARGFGIPRGFLDNNDDSIRLNRMLGAGDTRQIVGFTRVTPTRLSFLPMVTAESDRKKAGKPAVTDLSFKVVNWPDEFRRESTRGDIVFRHHIDDHTIVDRTTEASVYDKIVDGKEAVEFAPLKRPDARLEDPWVYSVFRFETKITAYDRGIIASEEHRITRFVSVLGALTDLEYKAVSGLKLQQPSRFIKKVDKGVVTVDIRDMQPPVEIVETRPLPFTTLKQPSTNGIVTQMKGVEKNLGAVLNFISRHPVGADRAAVARLTLASQMTTDTRKFLENVHVQKAAAIRKRAQVISNIPLEDTASDSEAEELRKKREFLDTQIEALDQIEFRVLRKYNAALEASKPFSMAKAIKDLVRITQQIQMIP